MTPGPRFSATTSASLIRRRAISLPSAFFRSMTVLRLLLLSSRKKKLSTFGLSLFHSRRARSPPFGFSILITSAPSQASIWVQDGPAWSCVKSMTRMPSKAWLISFSIRNFFHHRATENTEKDCHTGVPAKAGTHSSACCGAGPWIPACAGMTLSAPLCPPCLCGELKAAPHLRHDVFGEDLQLVEREAVRHPRPMHRGDDMV